MTEKEIDPSQVVRDISMTPSHSSLTLLIWTENLEIWECTLSLIDDNKPELELNSTGIGYYSSRSVPSYGPRTRLEEGRETSCLTLFDAAPFLLTGVSRPRKRWRIGIKRNGYSFDTTYSPSSRSCQRGLGWLQRLFSPSYFSRVIHFQPFGVAHFATSFRRADADYSLWSSLFQIFMETKNEPQHNSIPLHSFSLRIHSVSTMIIGPNRIVLLFGTIATVSSLQPASVSKHTTRYILRRSASSQSLATADLALLDTAKQAYLDLSIRSIERKEEQQRNILVSELGGEFFGTAWIVGMGSMASMAATFVDAFSTTPLSEISLWWSACVVSGIYMASSFFGGCEAHFNPAITAGNALFRNFEWSKVVPYSVAQTLGASAGSAASYMVYADSIQAFEENQGLVRASSIVSARVFGEYFDPALLNSAEALGVEAFGTAVLATIVFGLTHPSHHDPKDPSKLPIPPIVGSTIFLLINALGPLTQAGMNPARDFGPRLVAFANGWTDVAFQDCWVYIAGPLVGALVGAGLVDKVLYPALLHKLKGPAS